MDRLNSEGKNGRRKICKPQVGHTIPENMTIGQKYGMGEKFADCLTDP